MKYNLLCMILVVLSMAPLMGMEKSAESELSAANALMPILNLIKGIRLSLEGDFDAAHSLLLPLAQSNDNNVRKSALFHIGRCLYEQKKWDAAKEWFEKLATDKLIAGTYDLQVFGYLGMLALLCRGSSDIVDEHALISCGYLAMIAILHRGNFADFVQKGLRDALFNFRIAINGGYKDLLATLFKEKIMATLLTNNAEVLLFFAYRRGFADLVPFLLDNITLRPHARPDRIPDSSCSEDFPNDSNFDLFYPKGVNVNTHRLSLLRWAAALSDKAVIKRLIKHDSNRWRHNSPDTMSPLWWAIAFGRTDIVTYLIKKGAYVPKDCLRLAAKEGFLEIIKILFDNHILRDNGIDVALADESGMNALHYAAKRGHADIVSFLIAVAGIDINTTDKEGWTPLHWAAFCGPTDVWQLLIEKGADASAEISHFNMTALELASVKNRTHRVMLLEKVSRQPNKNAMRMFKNKHTLPYPQHYFSEFFNMLVWDTCENIKKDLRTRLDVGTPNLFGIPPLILAIQHGRIDVVALLLSKGVDVHSSTMFGRTPLFWALCEGYADIAALLVEKGASISDVERVSMKLLSHEKDAMRKIDESSINEKISTKDIGVGLDWLNLDGDDTWLKQAVKNQQFDRIELLLSMGARLGDIREPLLLRVAEYPFSFLIEWFYESAAQRTAMNKKTPLHLAAAAGCVKAIELFLSRGDAIDAGDGLIGMGDTPLHYAAINGHAEAVEALIARGAQVESIEGNDWTPLHRAAEKGHAAVVKILLRHGASKSRKNPRGRTAADIARDLHDSEHKAVLTLLQ